MAKEGDTVHCQVVAVEPDRQVEFGWGYFPGSVTLKLLEGLHEGDEVIMVNGSVQNVPVEDRVIGRVGKVRWETYGSYHGLRWVKGK